MPPEFKHSVSDNRSKQSMMRVALGCDILAVGTKGTSQNPNHSHRPLVARHSTSVRMLKQVVVIFVATVLATTSSQKAKSASHTHVGTALHAAWSNTVKHETLWVVSPVPLVPGLGVRERESQNKSSEFHTHVGTALQDTWSSKVRHETLWVVSLVPELVVNERESQSENSEFHTHVETALHTV